MARKKILYTFIICLLLFPISLSLAQGQPPPPPDEHGINGNQGAGGAAPVDGGSLLLLICSLGYGIVRLVRTDKGGLITPK